MLYNHGMQWLDTTIGKVRIEKQLARGGMAEVYLGTHLTLDRPVAIKVMHSYVEADEEMKLRFQREAKVVAALRHPNPGVRCAKCAGSRAARPRQSIPAVGLGRLRAPDSA